MSDNKFDDVKLVNLARYTFHTLPYSVRSEISASEDDKIQGLLKKVSFSNTERNYIIDFVSKYKGSRTLGIKAMKDEIFRLIGFSSSNHYGTLNRAEMEAIYNWFKLKVENK